MQGLQLIALFCLLFSSHVWADDRPLTYDRINLSASASEEVETDTLVAMLYAQKEDPDAEQAAGEVNQAMQKAQAEVQKFPVVNHQTQAYSTTPIYSKSTFVSGATVVGWRVRQSIRLESRDFAAMGRLIGTLQQTLALDSIDYSISLASRRTAEETLISEAIEHFKQRARLVTNAFGKQDYRLVEMHINTSGIAPRPYRVQAMSMESKSAPPPVLEAGRQRIEVQVSGTIELEQSDSGGPRQLP